MLPNRVCLPGRQVLPGASSAGSPRRSFTEGPSPRGLRAAQDDYQAAFAQYQQTVLTAFRQIADTLHALQNDADAVTAQRQALNSATKALGLNREAYVAGNTTILQVLDAQRLQQLAELSLVQVRTERFLQTVNLFVAAGGGLKPAAELNELFAGV